MRPHTHDRDHNQQVGTAFRTLVGDLVVESNGSQTYIDQKVGEHVNAVARAAYDLGQSEVRPSLN